jgi:hypothetical protein
MMSVADTTAMLSVMPKDLATSLMSLSFSSSWIGFLGGLGKGTSQLQIKRGRSKHF